MQTRVRKLTVHTRRAFAIARSSDDTFERVVLEVEEDGFTGRGEAAPSGRYDQDAESVAATLENVEVGDPWDIEGTLRLNTGLPPAALAALDNALHDLAARRLGVPVYRMLGLGKPEPISAYTLGIADRETTVADAELWVDANEAFSTEEAVELARELRGMVGMIEQPVPASAGPEALRAVTEAAHPVPVIADEGAVDARDVPKLAGSVSGVNVKLAKCGGIRGALEMVHAARAHGMGLMLGCMVETSLGIAAAAHVSGLFDYLDLDGAMLLADDPFSGLAYDEGRILLPDAPGLGVEPL